MVRVTRDGSSPSEGEDGGDGSDFTGGRQWTRCRGGGRGARGLLEKEKGERKGKVGGDGVACFLSRRGRGGGSWPRLAGIAPTGSSPRLTGTGGRRTSVRAGEGVGR
jgi:hypothetical protein